MLPNLKESLETLQGTLCNCRKAKKKALDKSVNERQLYGPTCNVVFRDVHYKGNIEISKKTHRWRMIQREEEMGMFIG